MYAYLAQVILILSIITKNVTTIPCEKKKEAESERKGKRNLMRREENRRGMGGDRRQGKRTGGGR